ncbi:MAG: caspase family protein [Cyanobacteria bacterium P01_A01_bin.17]
MGQLFTQGHACIVGVGADLPNTVKDAQGIANILQDPERCAYEPDQVQLLTAEQAARDSILAALDKLATTTDADATVLVYFSGHGYQVASPMGEAYYLMPHGYDQKKLYQTAISGAEFTAKLRAIPAKKLVILLDCCHAGGLSGFEDLGLEAAKAPLPPEAQAFLAEGSGRVVIASSKADEVSFAGKPYSAFTLAVIEALAGTGVAQKDGYVRVSDLALHAREVVPRRTRNRQHPILNFEQADNFVLAYYAGGEAKPKGLPFEVEPEIENEPGAFDQGGTQVIQNVTQQGKYNINIGQASGLRIGDG